MATPVTTKERERMQRLYAMLHDTQLVGTIVGRPSSTVWRHIDTQSRAEAKRRACAKEMREKAETAHLLVREGGTTWASACEAMQCSRSSLKRYLDRYDELRYA